MSRPLKVLIADDNPHMRITLRRVLSIFDCTITEAETGEEAFERISEEYFDVVFLDNKFPKADGIEIIKQIRKLNKAVGKIFFLTGYPEENTKNEAEMLGVFHFQNKKDLDLIEMRMKFNEAVID